MMIKEAAGLGSRLEHIPADELCPILDIGSSTSVFRTKTQPWIEGEVFAPSRISLSNL
jgi:hypothetical protein